jgi:hypothetical protein
MPKFETNVSNVLYFTNESGRGVFTSDRDGRNMRQIVGTNDAPTFRSARQLNAWIHRHLDT